MNSNVMPEQSYTRAWSDGRGEVKFFTRSDGSRLRYFTAGTGPPLVLLHTVRMAVGHPPLGASIHAAAGHLHT